MANDLTRIFVQPGLIEIKKKQILLSEKAKKFANLKIDSPYCAPNLEVYVQLNPDESRQLVTARIDTYHSNESPFKWLNIKKKTMIDCANLQEVYLCDYAENFTAEEYEIFGCPKIHFGEEYYSDNSINQTTKSITITTESFRITFNNWYALEKFKLQLPNRLQSENGNRSYFYSDHISFKNCPNLKEVDLTAIKSFSHSLVTFENTPSTCILKFSNPTEFYSDIHLNWSNSIAVQMFREKDYRDKELRQVIDDQCRLKIQLTDLFPEFSKEKIISVPSIELNKRLTKFINDRYLSLVKLNIEMDKEKFIKQAEEIKSKNNNNKGEKQNAK